MKSTLCIRNVYKCASFLLAILLTQYLFAQPVVTSFLPASGSIGTTVIITGTNFSIIPANNIVYFGAVKATVSAASSSSLTVSVPAGATFKPITVTVSNLTGYSDKPFIVTFPGGGTEFVAGSFSSKVDFVSGSNPESVCSSDFDGDGKPDVAVANTAANSVSIFKNVSASGVISFSPAVSYPTGNSPIIIYADDIDGDGKIDIVTSNYNSNSVSVFKNTSSGGNISFSAKIDLAVGINPFDVSIKDLDGDGKPDLAAINSVSNTVSILKNTSSNGLISFATMVEFPTGINPQGIWIGDLNADSKPDLAIVNGKSNTVSIFQNTSTNNAISFAGKVDYSTGNNPSSVTGADIDGDGASDLVIANTNGGSVFVLENTSNGGTVSFVPVRNYGVGGSPMAVSITDIDGDGKPDVSTANAQSGTVSLLKNTSTGGVISFANKVSYVSGTDPVSIVACDYDADGRPDIAVANAGSNTVSVLRNTVTNPFSPHITSFTPINAGTGTQVTITGTDFTGVTAVTFGGIAASSFTVTSSTILKAVVDTGASGNVSVTTPNGTATLGGFIYTTLPVISYFTPNTGGNGTEVMIIGTNFFGTTSVSFGRVKASLFSVISYDTIKAVVDTGRSGSVSITTRYGTASMAGFIFSQVPTTTAFTPDAGGNGTEVTISGTNLIGTTSVTFGGVEATSFTVVSATTVKALVGAVSMGSISILVTTPKGKSTISSFYTGPVIAAVNPLSGPIGTAVTITGTHFNTIADNNIVFFGAVKALVIAASDTTLTVIVPVGATYQPITVANNNLIASSNKPFTVTFPNNGSGLNSTSFNLKNAFQTGSYPSGISVADVDGDGKTDIAVTNSVSNTVSLFKNTGKSGAVSFAAKIDYGLATHPKSNLLSDFDGDGKPDIIVSNDATLFDYTFSVFKNNSTGSTISYSAKTDFPASSHPEKIATGDFNGDGKPDIVIGNAGASSISIFKNLSTTDSILFAQKVDYYISGSVSDVSVADFNGDGKPDIAVVDYLLGIISLYRNSGRNGNISFASKVDFPTGSAPLSIFCGDVDGDGRIDIAVTSGGNNLVSVLKNSSTIGFISFQPRIDYVCAGNSTKSVAMADLDGDGKLDIAVANSSSNSVSIFNNRSNNGIISFAPRIDYYIGYASSPGSLTTADIDADGKPDLVALENGVVLILRNQLGEPSVANICRFETTSITSNITGTNYQWQVNTGSGFINISDNENYSGTNTKTLQFTNTPSSWYGYQYRCVADVNNSETTTLKFVNTWTGFSSSAWENSGNWSCNSVPDANTDVIINSGSVIISSKVSCRSLQLTTGVSFNVSPGYTITIIH